MANLTNREFKIIADVLGSEVAAKLQSLFETPSGGSGTVTSVTGDFVTGNSAVNPVLSYQAWMATLPNYQAGVDDQGVIRMANGTFKCVIVNHQ